jgi:hypothetical protein
VKFKRLDLVVVRWIDSSGSGEEAWARIGEVVPGLRESVATENVSVGWVLFGDKACVILASHLSTPTPGDGDQCGGQICIPMVAVRSMRKVRA